jgi:hypothetical protein
MDYWGILGTLGAGFVIISNLPQVFLFVRQNHALGISKSSTWIYTIGVVVRTAYLMHISTDLNLLIPYYFGIFCAIVTLYYIYFGDEEV